MRRYFGQLSRGVSTSAAGLRLALGYFFEVFRKYRGDVASNDYFEDRRGTFTVQFPKETIPVPDHGRYKLHNEIDDCIVCDKCAKVCPVNCIDIEPIRSTETFGTTADGTPKRIYAAKFDIDMSKCCFCGLCTTVCPTECLTMTSEYDFSTFDIRTHNFPFGNMSAEEIDIKKLAWEKHQQAKTPPASSETGAKPKPAMKPKPKPFRPRMK